MTKRRIDGATLRSKLRNIERELRSKKAPFEKDAAKKKETAIPAADLIGSALRHLKNPATGPSHALQDCREALNFAGNFGDLGQIIVDLEAIDNGDAEFAP